MQYVPFSRKELEPKGYFTMLPAGKAPIYNTPISPRENYLLALRGEKPFWIPLFTDCKKFMANIFPDNLVRGAVLSDEPFDRSTLTGGLDMFGIDWEYVPQVGGATVRPGKPFAEEAEEIMEKTIWPDPKSWDWEGCALRNRNYLTTDFALNATIFCGFFERLISFMDFENAAVALIDDDSKPYVHQFFDRLASLYEEMIPLMKQHFHLDSLEFHDDWGSQRAPLFGVETLREMIYPYLKRVVDCVHANDMIFEMHSCGNHAEHTPVMIEAGVDCWAPQFNANDTRAIFEEYGDRITIGVSCPLPIGSPDDQYVAWAHQFVEECVGRPDKRTPFVHNMRTPEIFRQTIYELSRRKLCGSEND